MEKKIENADKVIAYWKDSSDQNFNTMQNLLKTKDYDWALFIGHLVIEKLLKAIYVKKYQEHAIFTHDLLRLSIKSQLTLTEETKEWLDDISTFNLNARYDNYKKDFHRLCTKEYADIWITRIKILRQWLINQL